MKKMIIRILFAILLISLGFAVNGQNPNNKIYQKFHNADSVILVSHLTTNFPMVEKGKKKPVTFFLVSKNKPNNRIIKERYRLSEKDIDSVANILIEVNTDSFENSIKCFIPHHGILIFKDNNCAYFDICFGCRHFITSNDINISDALSDKTWIELESFFRRRKLNYEMPEKESIEN